MRNTPTELILLHIAEGFQKLSQNPDISQVIKNMYALSESEKAKYDAAQQTMANADKFLADLNTQKDALAKIEDRIAKAQAMEDANTDSLIEIKRQNTLLERVAQKNQDDAKANDALRKELEKRKDDLDIREGQLLTEKDNIKKTKADLKKRAEVVSQQVTGL